MKRKRKRHLILNFRSTMTDFYLLFPFFYNLAERRPKKSPLKRDNKIKKNFSSSAVFLNEMKRVTTVDDKNKPKINHNPRLCCIRNDFLTLFCNNYYLRSYTACILDVKKLNHGGIYSTFNSNLIILMKVKTVRCLLNSANSPFSS